MKIVATSLVLLSLLSGANAQCGPDGGSFSIAGSTTVLPVAELWAASYMELCPGKYRDTLIAYVSSLNEE